MELNLNRFSGNVSKHLICSICLSVFKNPLQDPDDHIFCENCIKPWVIKHFTCPIDRKKMLMSDLKPVSRTVKNLLDELDISCDYKEHGCQKVLKLEALTKHVSVCEYDPTKMVTCPNGCEKTMRMSMLKEHSCIKELKSECKRLQTQIDASNKEWRKCIQQLYEQFKNEIIKIRNETNTNKTMKIDTNMIIPPPNLTIPATANNNNNLAITTTVSKNNNITQFQPYYDADLVIINGVETEVITAFQCNLLNSDQQQKYSADELRYQYYTNAKNVKK